MADSNSQQARTYFEYTTWDDLTDDNEADSIYNITAVKQNDESVNDLQLQFSLID